MVDYTKPGADRRADAALDDLFRQIVAWGGSITESMVLGWRRSPGGQLAVSKETRELHRTVKHALDPKGILNPGKFYLDQRRFFGCQRIGPTKAPSPLRCAAHYKSNSYSIESPRACRRRNPW